MATRTEGGKQMVDESTLLGYVITYLQEELDRSGYADESPELLRQLFNDALAAYAEGAR